MSIICLSVTQTALYKHAFSPIVSQPYINTPTQCYTMVIIGDYTWGNGTKRGILALFSSYMSNKEITWEPHINGNPITGMFFRKMIL